MRVFSNIQCGYLSEVRIPNSGRQCVAIAFSKAGQAALFTLEPISPRLARARMKGAMVNITVIAVNAPTLDAEEEVSDSLCDDLQSIVFR